MIQNRLFNLTNKIFRNVINKTNDTSFSLQCPLFPNQINFGKKITKSFLNKDIFMLLAIAPTQSGKTGSMISTIMYMCRNPRIALPKENVFIITGLSSKDWVNQTKERFPIEIQNNIYHRNTLNNFVDKAKNKKNILIIIDESQYACLKNQAIHNAFYKIGIMDTNYISNFDVKILLFSATPDGCVYDLNRWEHSRDIIYMDVPKQYKSIQYLLKNNQIKQYKDLCGFDKLTQTVNSEAIDNIKELKQYIKNDDPKYHLIRTHNSYKHKITIENFKQAFKNNDYLFYSENKINMEKMLMNKPNKHTFIFIKEKLRCAQTIYKKYLGILYERTTSIVNDSTIIQGFAGRLTGYHNNTTSIVFTNIESIEKYTDLVNNKFQIKKNNSEINDKILSQIESNTERKNKIKELNEEFKFWISNSTKKKIPYTKGTFLELQSFNKEEL